MDRPNLAKLDVLSVFFRNFDFFFLWSRRMKPRKSHIWNWYKENHVSETPLQPASLEIVH